MTAMLILGKTMSVNFHFANKNIKKEKKLLPLLNYFQERGGQIWTFAASNEGKAQLDYIIKKWKNSEKNYRAYNLFEGAKSDHCVISAKIILTLRANKNESYRNSLFDWSSLKDNMHIAKSFTLQLKNRLHALQKNETENSPNNIYNNFVSFCENAAKESVSLRNKIKKRVPWGSEDQKNQNQLQSTSNFNIARDNLHSTFESEQKKHNRDKIDETSNAEKNQTSSQTRKVVNEIGDRKTTGKVKLRAKNETERLNIWT